MNREVSADKPNYSPNNPRRQKFDENQFTAVVDAESNEEEASPSAKNMNLSFCYKIIEFASVFSAIADIAICKSCKQKLSFGELGNRGLGFKISVKCMCGITLINSSPFIQNSFEINRRIVFAMRLLGVVREGINIFCEIMNLGHGIGKTPYKAIIRYINDSAKRIFDYTCKKAIEEEKKLNERNERPLLNITVSGDGSWKKCGVTPHLLYDVTTLIAYHTGKVIDFVVKGSCYQACTHYDKEDCPINYTGSARKIKVDAVLEMFRRSEELFGVKYSNYINDGDAKTFKAILDAQPYGEDFKVTKSECVSHVKKRMGSCLQEIKITAKLGGEGKLTDDRIKKLTKYYGRAIRRNVNSVEETRKAIMATYYHMISTDENPQHDYCPSGVNSWCLYRVAEAVKGLKFFEHPTPLHPDVQKHILPIYEDLSDKDLLGRCLSGYTQNANESFNATVWRLVPEHRNYNVKMVETAAFLTAGMFNEGYTFILQMMQDLDLEIGQHCKYVANIYDMHRVQRQKRRSLDSTKEAETPLFVQTALLEQFEEKKDD